MIDTDMTSDILIYNILKSTDDEFIRKCNLKFIDKSVPAMEDDTIYIANVDLEPFETTFDKVTYKALVNIYVKTKQTDYLKGSRFLRTVVKHIKKVLRDDNECKERGIIFRNTTYEYAGKYTLKGLHLLVQMMEHETTTFDDKKGCVNVDAEDMQIKKE